jgi:hypothetical protein
MIPPALARMLPHLGIALLIVGALWSIDHAGYRRAMAEREARDARLRDALRSELRRSEQRLALAIDRISADYQGRHDALAALAGSLRPIIIGEKIHAPRLADPALGLTPGLLAAVNRARAAGACAPTAAGAIACALPAAPARP